MRPRKRNAGLPKRVYERHGAWFLVRHDGTWVKLARVSEGEARMYAALATVMQGGNTSSPGTTQSRGDMPAKLRQFEKIFLPHLATDTRTEYRRNYRVIAEAFAEFNVAEVTPGDVEDFLESNWPDKLTAKGHYKARLSTFFSWAARKRYRGDNPCAAFKIPKAPPRRHKVEHNELMYMIRALSITSTDKRARDPRPIARLIALTYLTAQRSTDIRTLRWDQIHEGGIHFTPSKTRHSSGKTVTVTVTEAILSVLLSTKTIDRVVSSPFVFPDQSGKAYSARNVRDAWNSARRVALKLYLADCKASGQEANPNFLKGATVKDLRSKSITDGHKSGLSIEQLRIAAGHMTTSMTERYLRDRENGVSDLALDLPKGSGVLDTSPNPVLDSEGGK